ncbi:hypothetical protein FKM82_021655 [Ascaphus truei]
MRGLWLILGGLVSLPPYSSTSQAVCDYQTLIGDDENFCSRDLHVIYPDIGDVSCLYIPDCFDYPESLSKVWGHPRIKYAKSQPVLPHTGANQQGG